MLRKLIRTKILGFILLSVLLLSLPVWQVYGADWIVTVKDEASLNIAIAVANSASAGTYTITFVNDITIIGAITVINLPADVSLIIDGSDYTLDGGGNRGLTIDSGTVEIRHLTITNGYNRYEIGGGIYNIYGTVTITSSTVSGNSAFYAGGIANDYGTVTITNSTISDNNSVFYGGGGIYNNYGTVTITNSTVSGNSADNRGGGIANDYGTVTITNSAVSGNSTNQIGGGIYNDSGTVTITDSTVSGNSAGGGGGIFNGYGTGTITNSTMSGNSAISGGGILNYGTVMIINSTVSSNSVGYYGGGIYNGYGTGTITNSTVSGNSAGYYGGGIFNSDSTVMITNSIVAGNSFADCYGYPLSGGYNLFTTTGACPASADDVLVDMTDVFKTVLEPKLQDNGGPTLTHALQDGSPALDQIDPTLCPASDQRGVSRPQNGTCDIGAFELELNAPPTADAQGPYTVDEGGTVSLSGSGNDPEGGLLSYAWDLDNDGSFDTAEQNPIFSALDRDGPSSQTLVLQVCDPDGLCDTDTTTIEIKNMAPTASFLPIFPMPLLIGESQTFVFSAASDPSSADTTAGFDYFVDCYDDGNFVALQSSTFDCSYPAADEFGTVGRIRDKDGGSTDYEIMVEVLSPEAAIIVFKDSIDNLQNTGVINHGKANALATLLQHIQEALDRGNPRLARNLINANINQIEALVNSDRLSAEEGQEIISFLQRILWAIAGAG